MRWKEVRLEEVCEISGGGTPSRAIKEYFGGEIAWFTPTEIAKDRIDKISSSKETITELGLGNSSAKLLPPGSVLMTSRASIGNVAIIEKQATTNQGFVNFICSPHINNRYLAHWLYSNKNQFENAANGATFKEISRGKIKTFKVPLPDLPTQQHIAAVLDKADALRQQNQQLLTYYDELLQGTFIELFGDPVTNEKGWEVKKLGEVADVVSGVAKNSNIKGDLVEAPYMRVANVQDGVLNLNEIKTIVVYRKDFEKYQLKKNDILMTEGGDPDKLGRSAIWNEEVKECIHQNHIFRVRPDLSIINPVYLCTLNGTSYSKRYFLKAAKQTTGIASINMTQLKNFPALLPPLSLQNQFAEIVERVETQKAQAQAALTASEALFEGLLAGYFGEKQSEEKGSNPCPPTSQLRLF